MINVISFPNLGLNFTINRVAFTIGGISVYWYGLIIAFGLLLAICCGISESKKSGLDNDDFLNMLLIALPVSIICARAYYVIFNFDLYKNDLLSILDIRGGGIAIYGAVIGAALTVIIYCKNKKINIGTVLDILAVGLLIGQSIGRWGNFVNGEAFGGPTTSTLAMTIASGGSIVAKSVHPTFLYESLWNGLGIIFLIIYKKFRKFNGEIFCGYMVWYGIGRAIIEGLRADSLYIGALRVSQILSIILVLTGIILIIKNRKKSISE